MPEPITSKQLESEWGIERYMEAMKILSRWYSDKKHPISVKKIEELYEVSLDAYELFCVRQFEIPGELDNGIEI